MIGLNLPLNGDLFMMIKLNSRGDRPRRSTKTGGVKSITERLGGSEYRQFHRGGSDHVNV